MGVFVQIEQSSTAVLVQRSTHLFTQTKPDSFSSTAT